MSNRERRINDKDGKKNKIDIKFLGYYEKVEEQVKRDKRSKSDEQKNNTLKYIKCKRCCMVFREDMEQVSDNDLDSFTPYPMQCSVCKDCFCSECYFLHSN